jgi:hypothetical protein
MGEWCGGRGKCLRSSIMKEMVYHPPPQRAPPTNRTSTPSMRGSGAPEHTLHLTLSYSLQSTPCHARITEGMSVSVSVLFGSSIRAILLSYQQTAKTVREEKVFACRCEMYCVDMAGLEFGCTGLSDTTFRPAGSDSDASSGPVPCYRGRLFFGHSSPHSTLTLS